MKFKWANEKTIKLWAVLLCAVLCLPILAACGAGSVPTVHEEEPEQTTETQTAETEKVDGGQESDVPQADTNGDIALYRLADTDDAAYTLSATSYGSQKANGVDKTPYVERLLNGVTLEIIENSEMPEGEYIMLDLPEANVRYDFFLSDGNDVREISDDGETLYRAAYADGTTTAYDAVSDWYDALVAAAAVEQEENAGENALMPTVEECTAVFAACLTYEPGISGAFLKEAQATCEMMGFAVSHDLHSVDSGMLSDTLREAFQNLSDDEAERFLNNYSPDYPDGIYDLGRQALEDYETVRGSFNDAGVGSDMEGYVSFAGASDSWEALKNAILTVSHDGDGLSAETPSEAPASRSEASATQTASDLLAGMTTEEKVCQLFLVTQDQLTGVSPVTKSGDTTRSAIQSMPVGGIVYFSSNLVSREQCVSMIENIQSYSKLGLFIAVDEEGGKVARLSKNPAMGTTVFPAMQEIGATGDTDRAYQVGHTIGTEIAELGFNLDFAPVADVFSNPNNTVIGSRAFSSDPKTAADMVAACVKGFNDSGMLCTLKHFPGHGDTNADSHYGEAETGKTLEQLEACEFLPFEAGIKAGAPFVMIGHIAAPNVISEAVPASLSHEMITGLLREQLGIDGIVITDSMSMKAITDQYSSGEAAVMALKAGADIILMPEDLRGAVDGVLDAIASGELSEERIDESVLRILGVKLSNGIIDAG